MNEYIKELLLKVVPMEGEDGDLFPSLYTKKQIEEFAGLIVKECIQIVSDAVDHREPASTYMDKIRKHFGVEQ
jgi:hypothetical protein